ncbi:MAG: hypothetical protein OEZ36_12285, partial [Spirochaetota bacterium]|nr:hypothetical protein [Spirochaetota bacterium]
VKTDENLYIKGDVIRAKVKAKYYFGSPVTKGKVEYHVYRKRYFVPWWDTTYGWYYSASLAGSGGGSRSQEVLSGRNIDLKPDGSLDIVIDTKKIAAKYKDRFHFGRSTEPDYSYSISVTVVDQSRRHVSGSKSFLLTRSDHHLKLSTGRWLYSPNKPIDIKIQAKRFDGSFLKGKKVRVEFYQELWERSFGKYIYKTNLLNKQEGLTGKDGVLELSYTPSKPMWMIIKAISKDERGNITISRRHVYVYSSSQRSKRKGRGSITIITDKSGYKNGEHAQIVFNTPVQNGHLLVTCEISSIPFAKVIPINNGNASLKLKLVDAYTPNTWVNATMIFDNRLYTARKEIIVPPIQKFLSVSVQGNKKQYRPGEQAEFTIKATDYRGRPVRSEISVGIVDASIYGIAPERTPDIRKAFYTRKYNAVSTTSSLYFRFIGRFENRTLMSRLQNKADTKYGSYKEEDGKLKEARVRKDFKDEILWLPAVRTNHNGIARVKFNFPDNLTRWRTTVRSVTKDTMVGNVTQSTIVRKNLMVRLAIPRFYRENDKATVTTIVHNYLNKPKKVHLTLSTKGIQLTSPQKMSLTVPVNGIKKVDWQVQTKRAGMATFLVKALTDEESDALQQTVPVLPHGMKSMDPLVTELRKNSDKFFHNVILKDNYSPGHSELQVDIAPSLVVAMNAALPYLVKEPYGCVEQTMSRFMPLVLVDDLVKKTGYRDVNMKDKIATYYEKGINRLYNLQHPDGGWGWWNNDQSYPGMTAYALSGLLLAKKV